jgi:hypothetical protein
MTARARAGELHLDKSLYGLAKKQRRGPLEEAIEGKTALPS